MSKTSESETNKLGLLGRFGQFLMQPRDTVLYRHGRSVTKYEVDTFLDMPNFERLQHMPEYAMLTAITYGQVRNGTATVRGENVVIPDGWTHRSEFPDASMLSSTGGIQLSGLKFDVWHSVKRDEVAIAFRGTDGHLGDWVSNARWVTRFVPGISDYYDQLGSFIDGLVNLIDKEFEDTVTITTLGHSLGGGLAQHAAYHSVRIKRVFAFNASPVTGYFSVPRSDRTRNREGVLLARIFEHGEILAFVRFFLRKLYSISTVDPEIVELRFNFLEVSNLLTEHSMHTLADRLWHHTRKKTDSR